MRGEGVDPNAQRAVDDRAMQRAARATARLLQCFGRDEYGGLGVGRRDFQSVPVVLSELGAVRIASVNPALNTALTEDRRVYWWGRDPTQPSDPLVRPVSYTPRYAPGFDGAMRMVMGEMVICAQMSREAVQCMGWNLYGAVGDGTYELRPEPVPVLGFEQRPSRERA